MKSNSRTGISLHRLHRLRPRSDVEELRKLIAATDGAHIIFGSFLKYLLVLHNPSAVELDDVTRICLQLNAAGLWEAIPPSAIAKYFHWALDRKIVDLTAEVLGFDSKTAKFDGVIRRGENPAKLEKLQSQLGLPKGPPTLLVRQEVYVLFGSGQKVKVKPAPLVTPVTIHGTYLPAMHEGL